MPVQDDYRPLDTANGFQQVGGRVPAKERGADCAQPQHTFPN